jgi:hypothetical protein
MKYVIFRSVGSQLLHPVIFPESTTHSQIHILGAKPVAAGFVELNHKKEPKIHGNSESLRLGSGPRDRELIIAALMSDGTNSFIDYKDEYKEPFKI